MSWGILERLNDATGRDIAPGEPGSLLHTIVTRAMSDGLPAHHAADLSRRAPRAQRPDDTADPHDTYVVQPDDTLRRIAQRVYGDSAAFGRIFAANHDRLTSPEDLQSGQVLRLPRP
jgi:nucleoid-associated protein YgaU